MNAIRDLKTRLFPKGVKRTMRTTLNRVARRTTTRAFARALRELGIDDGSQLCVHSQLSSFGYLVGGPRSVVDAMFDAVPNATVMMPTFTFGGTCEQYLADDPVFDPATSPSVSGLLTHTLWQMPGALRSMHPTHPCAALGPEAKMLIEGSEQTVTPFGDHSTYGRFQRSPNAVLLLLNTNSTSLIHRFQEVADAPHLFLPGLRKARSLGPDGQARTYEVKIHTPRYPFFIIVRGDTKDAREYMWMPDYILPAPAGDLPRIRSRLHGERVIKFLLDRHEAFVKEGVITSKRFRDGELVAVRMNPYFDRITEDLRASYAEFADEYDLENLKKKDAEGLLRR